MVLGNATLVVVGLGLALILMELLLRTYPNWVPREVRVDPPVRRKQTFIDQTYDIKLSSGDLFYWMRGKMAPLPPDQDKVLAQVHLTTDANGFRNPLPSRATYDIVTLGDSFTVAGNVASPWPRTLETITGRAVLNLGEAGDGPQQELELFRSYGRESLPQWVILAYFEGNDLYDAASYEQASQFILPRFGKYILQQGSAIFSEKNSAGNEAIVKSDYLYPISLTVNNNEHKIAFFSYYISWLSANHEAIETSQNFRLVRETILQMQELCEGTGANFLLIYVPSKEHVYLPYLKDVKTIKRVFTKVPAIDQDQAGYLQFSNKSATAELISQHIDDQAQVLADFAAENHIQFLDLTPFFQEELSTGAELYYPFDTHWNQLGHDLAAGIINKYIEESLPDVTQEHLGH